ncbi:hypothetical protein UFOVP37_33 [uncultured Caudovirales phage]|uniref:Uncharacterized protein n=1 Tax=uncultured Caudovirales phage TaxID=2100421 RepID=A0A6J5KQS3_9CAUD|nr:hypothetical protein UFOVP37_33 [uncultured Caudovirales phage]
MATQILRSQPGIKRDGTKFDGEFYTDGQWVRFQRGLPRKIGGYRSISKYLTEISRGFMSFTQQLLQYCHSGGPSTLERFTIDASKNSSLISNRTPVAVAAKGTVTLTGGASGAVNGITVNSVQIMSGAVSFTTDLATTAAAVATNINLNTSIPDYTASAVGAVITITAVTANGTTNGYALVATTTTITATSTDMANGSDALTASDANKWMFQAEFDSSTQYNSLLAHVSPNGRCLCNDLGGQIFYGDLLGTAPLKSVQLPAGANVTGGIVALHPFLFYYGTAGIIGWSVAGEPTNLTGSGSGIARVWSQKIVKGMPLRAGAGSAPAGLFWAYDAVIRATFTGGSAVFQFDTIATDTSILSADSVVDYDGVFFWAGVDRFFMFNGVVRDVPNQMNINYFLEGLNPQQHSKVFAWKVPRFGEIWWAYPKGDATECTHAVIYNVRENTWYDTALPESGRSAGGYNNAFMSPILVDAVPTASGYRTWVHEQGVDMIDGTLAEPIQSYFETADLSPVAQGSNEYMRISIIEPDFVQNGPMTVQVTGRANARAPEVYSSIFTFPDQASQPYEQIVMLKEQRRELRLRFESNALYGDYQMGQIIGHLETGDKTVLG